MFSPSRSFLFTVVLCFAALFIVVHFAIPAHAADLEATEWTLKADDGKGGAGEEVDSFLPTDHKLHFVTTLNEKVPVGTKLKFTFTAVDTDAGKNLKITDVEITADKSDTLLSSSISATKDWPVGDYRVDLSADGKQIGSFDYSVEEGEDEGEDKDDQQ